MYSFFKAAFFLLMIMLLYSCSNIESLITFKEIDSQVIKDGYIESFQKGVLYRRPGFPLQLVLTGTHYEMGVQEGVLLKKEIRFFAENLRDLIIFYAKLSGVPVNALYAFIKSTSQEMVLKLPLRFKQELAGIASGSGVPLEALYIFTAFDDLYRTMACTGILAITPDDKLIHARNEDNGFGQYYLYVIIKYKPDEFNSFISIGNPGWIGVSTAYNLKGIGFSHNTRFEKPFLRFGYFHQSMSTEDNLVYEKLRRQIDKMPVGMPKTDTGEEIRILKHLFTPKEAEAALFLNMVFEPAAKIYRRAKGARRSYSREEIEGILANLAAKGAILERVHKGKKEFSYAQFVIGMFELQVDRITKDFARDSFEYTRGGFGRELHRTKLPQLRAIPINKHIVNEQHIGTYDNIRELVRKTDGQFGLMNCICRQRKDLIGKKCKVTSLRQTCITFPHTTPLFQSFGTNHPVTKKKILAILERAEKEGLVIQLGNSQVPMVVCCCCGDCCEILVSAKKFPRPAELFTTNYYAEIDAEKCSGCLACVKRCQMNAPVIGSGDPHIDLDRCIGCSLCVSSCARKAIILRKKKKTFVPPKNETALFTKILF